MSLYVEDNNVRGVGLSSEGVEIRKEFVECAIAIRNLLRQAKKKCDSYDKRNPTIGDQRNFIIVFKPTVFQQLNTFFAKLSEISVHFGHSEYLVHQSVLQHFIVPMFAPYEATLNYHIYFKPLGYAGDFIVTQLICENEYPGTTTYGKLVNRYTLEQPLAKAHLNRKTYLERSIERVLSNEPHEPVRIASLACGPASEIFSFVEVGEGISGRVVFTCVDAERMAIQTIHNRLSVLGRNHKLPPVHLIHENLLSFVRGKKQWPTEKQDLLYCAGFFDYVNDATVTKCLKAFLEWVKPGGLLIAVNVADHSSSKAYLEMGGEWYLHGRTADRMRSLVPAEKRIASKHVFVDPLTLMNLYLVVRKGA